MRLCVSIPRNLMINDALFIMQYFHESLLKYLLYRLCSGYLEDQKCMDAAKTFLDTSPHLQECRFVMSSGRRFSTRVSGMTLTDVIEKFFAINATGKKYLNLSSLWHKF